MKITGIIVENYRSLRRVNVELGKFSIFVGQNNHGKTNFFEAIDWFYNAKSSEPDEHFGRDTSNQIKVEVFFEDVIESDIEKLSIEANKTKIRTLLGTHNNFSMIKTSVDHKKSFIVNNEGKVNPTGLDTAINEFLPKLEYVNTKIRLDDVSKYKEKNPIGTMLSGVLSAIIESSKDYQDFKNQFSKLFDDESSEVRKELNRLGDSVEIYLQKQFPDGTKVRFGVNAPQFSDLLKSFDTIVDDGIETKAEDKGDGMQRAIMLSIIQAFADYRRNQTGGGTFLFMIDEAELHLHPSAQRALKQALREICTIDQVLVNTHSSVLVVDQYDNQKIFRVEKENSITEIKEIDELGKIDVIFELLGGSPSDLLLPRNFLIVEGQCEFEFLTTVIKRFYPDQYRGIKILFARGDIIMQQQSLWAIHRLYSPLAGSDNPIYKEKVIILIDKQNQSQQKHYKTFQDNYPYIFKNNQCLELPTETLEGYYPSAHRKKSDDLIKLKPEEKVSYAREVAQNITLEELEKEMPVICQALAAADAKAFNPNSITISQLATSPIDPLSNQDQASVTNISIPL
jgi:putative ATP-dependent endonuclease of the OLD family